MINELEQQILELENELSDQYAYIMELEIYYDEQVKSRETELNEMNNKITDLEYELFVEKTRDSKHRFYWFTAKIPLVADLSYTDNENDFYGFNQPPKYSVIEKHDLRFITNCSVDELIEQFR